jgi:molybdopterin/thiamine biosynthesis adenylyltransferase
MTGVSDRHSSTLDGKLNDLGIRSAVVSVVVDDATASTYAVQHTAWILINLLARLEGVVSSVMIAGGNVGLLPHVVPLSTYANTLRDASLEGARSIGAVPVCRSNGTSADYELHVGPGPATDSWRVHGEGYCGAISRRAIASVSSSRLPFGPYIAACLAAGEIFRAVRMRPDLYDPATSLSFSAWDYTLGPGALHEIGPDLGEVVLDFGLAGAGAVGCAFLHALWACPQLGGDAVIADSDRDGVDDTNLNRCIIFGRQHLGMPKATTAASILADASITWQPVDDRYARATIPRAPDVLVSAVDTNKSRGQLQQGFWPARLLAASTRDLRAEVLRCGPPGEGRCLSCFNPPEVDIPDNVRREQLRALSPEGSATFAAEIGHPVALVRRWAEEGGCSSVGDAALARMRGDDEPPTMFAVGFVSVMAGTLLAVETIKEHIGRPTPLDDEHQNAKFQFEHPSAERNGRATAVQRDPNCSTCVPGGAGAEVWTKRWGRHANPPL